MKNRTVVHAGVLCVLLAFGALPAEAGSGGSMYSIMGIGDIRISGGARSAGMGYAGTALASTSSLNFLSPATWSQLARTRLEAGALYEGFASSDARRSRYLAHVGFSGAMLGIPVSPEHGVTLAAAFLPYSNVDYDTYTGGTARSAADSVAYTFHHVGTGGLTLGRLGLSCTVTGPKSPLGPLQSSCSSSVSKRSTPPPAS